MASTYLSRTLGTSTNVYKGTVSHWVKRAGLGAMGTFAAWNNGVSDTNRAYLNFNNDDIYFYDQANSMTLETNRKFRDVYAWYHIVCAWDTSQGTAADRVKIYVNGVQETSFSTANYPSVNSTLQFNTSGRTFGLGSYANSGAAAGFFNGSMANVEFVDGTALTPAYFGSTDSNTGIWKPGGSSTISSYGTNGFKLAMDTSTPGADTSGNTNNFTVGAGTPTLTQGSPSNVFATMNPLIPGQTNYTYSNGNLTITQGSSAWVKSNSTIGMSSGKYYWEAKYVSGLYTVVGVDKTDTATPYPSTSSSAVGWKRNGNVEVATNPQTDIASYAHGDIVSVALDMDNACVYFGKGGVWQNSGDPTSGASKTGAYSLPSYVANTPYFATVSPYESGATSMNFGEGFFGTTAAGTQADDNGQGLFAYDVPAGYYALNTKNLEAYG